jgi:hypothetical protein
MARNFTTQPTPAETAEILNAQSTQELYELLQSKVARERMAAENTPQPAAPQPPPAPASDKLPTHQRFVYPSGNIRIMLQGYSDEELDRQEAAIRAAYSGQ